jgi:hypothetical protein
MTTDTTVTETATTVAPKLVKTTTITLSANGTTLQLVAERRPPRRGEPCSSASFVAD